MNGWRTLCSTLRSVSVCFTWLRITMSDFFITFIAYRSPVAFLRTCITLPYVPRPITRSSSKSESETGGPDSWVDDVLASTNLA